MRTHLTCLAFVLALVAVSADPLFADAHSTNDWSVRGGFQLGFRVVDVDGRAEKYREDVNLEDGPRLFHFDFDLASPEELRQYFDHLEMTVENAGGDPFESMRFKVEKYGRYSLSWEQRKSSYFYEDIILPPELAVPEVVNAGDLHTFDFDRVRDSASFTLWVGGSGRFDFGFDRFTKKGHSETTYDVQRDEFEMERPIDESLNEYQAGFSWDWERVTLVLREHLRDYENSVEAFLPGASDGSTSDDPTVLDFFFLREPYDLSSQGHSAALIARPTDRLLLELAAVKESFDLDLDVSERSQGTDFMGLPFSVDTQGSGELDRDLELVDLSVSYRLSDRVAVTVDGESKSLKQDGSLSLAGSVSDTALDLETTGAEAAIQFEATSELSFSAGVRNELREVGTVEETGPALQETDHSGYFAMVGWRPERHLSVSAKFETSSYDNPFAAASPSDRESVRLRARYAKPMGLSLSGTYRLDDLDNSDSGWRAELEQLGLRAGYRFATLSLSAGYSRIDADRGVDQTVVTLPGFMGGLELLFPVAYSSDTEVFDARVSWAVNPRLKLGGDVRLYENDGSFPLEREQLHLYSEVGLGKGYVAHLGLRSIDYDEGLDDFDDYRAEIAELSFGYRWR